MRLIIEARLADGDNDTVEEGDGVLAVIERPDCCLAELGLTLAEGRSLLAKVQAELISKQVPCSRKCCRWTRAFRPAASGIGFSTLENSSTLISSVTSRNYPKPLQTRRFANPAMSRP